MKWYIAGYLQYLAYLWYIIAIFYPVMFAINNYILLQAVTVTPLPNDDDYLMAEIEGRYGKIPSTYVEFL